MHLLRYILRKLLNRFLDRPELVDWKSIERCHVSAEPVKMEGLNTYGFHQSSPNL